MRPLRGRQLSILAIVLSSGLACADLIGLRAPQMGDGSGGLGGENGGPDGAGAVSSGGSDNGDGGSEDGGSSSDGGTTSGGTSGGDGGDGGSPSTGGTGTGGENSIPEPSLVTSAPDAYWQVDELSEALSTTTATVTVDTSNGFQEWLGFGGTFTERGWQLLQELTQAERERALTLLFGTSDGANFTWGRVPIGATQYSIDRYTLTATPSGGVSLERDQMYTLPFIHAAQAVKPGIRFWAQPWTPPPYMKTSDSHDGGSLQASYYAEYADYFVHFVEAYETEDVIIEQVQPQNQADTAGTYPSCIWEPAALADFVGNYLAPALKSAGLDTQILYGSISEPNEFAAHVAALTPALQDKIAGIGLDWGNVANVAAAQTFGLVMQTEHRGGNYPWLTGYKTPAPNDHAYAEESWGLIRDWIAAGAHAYMAWHMVLDEASGNLDVQRPWAQNSLLIVDTVADALIVTPAYHVFRHVSQYVEPGAIRVDISTTDGLAFLNPDGSVVAILYNPSANPDETVLGIDDVRLELTVPAHGWATVNWQN